MLEYENFGLATGYVHAGGRGIIVDRKAMLMVRELCRFGMSVVGISETNWFGSAVYDVDKCLILHSDCAVPGEGEKVERNEGVGVVLEPGLADSWRQGGEQWKPVMAALWSQAVALH